MAGNKKAAGLRKLRKSQNFNDPTANDAIESTAPALSTQSSDEYDSSSAIQEFREEKEIGQEVNNLADDDVDAAMFEKQRVATEAREKEALLKEQELVKEDQEKVAFEKQRLGSELRAQEEQVKRIEQEKEQARIAKEQEEIEFEKLRLASEIREKEEERNRVEQEKEILREQEEIAFEKLRLASEIMDKEDEARRMAAERAVEEKERARDSVLKEQALKLEEFEENMTIKVLLDSYDRK